MKKMIEKFKYFYFVIALLFFASNAFANDSKPSLKIVTGKNNVFTLISNTVNNSDVTIRIFDQEGVGLLREKIEVNRKFSKSYDLSNLPEGIYEVEIEDHISFRKYFVITNPDTLEIIENGEQKIFKPVVALDNDMLKFNLLNLESGDVELIFSNEIGEEVYTEKIINTIAIHKGFDFSKLASGRYTISVKTKAKVFNVEVDLK